MKRGNAGFRPNAPILEELFPKTIDNDLQLLLLEEKHARELYLLVDSSRVHLRQFLPFVDEYQSVDAATSFIRRCQEKLADRSGLGIGIWFKENIAGVVTYDYLDWDNRATRIGYWLGKTFEGQGMMTRTCRVLVDLAFRQLGMNRVEIWCAYENARCRRVPERLGFQQEDILRQRERVRDHFVDIVSYSMLMEDWRHRTV